MTNDLINNYAPVSKNHTKKNNKAPPKSVKIVEFRSVSSQKKARSPSIYNAFHLNEKTGHSKHHKKNKFLSNFPFKMIGVKSKSTDKTNQNKSKFGQYNNHSKHYCITLNQYAQYKQDYLSLNTQSNTKNKNKNKMNRPSTAPQKNKKLKRKNHNHNSKGNNEQHVNNFIGFNGIVNIQSNLIQNNNNKNNIFIKSSNNNNKYNKENKNNRFFTLFNPTNTFTNNILMNISNGFHNNKFMIKLENSNTNNMTLFSGNNRRLNAPRIFISQNGFSNKTKNDKDKIRLNSAVNNDSIHFNNNSNSKKKGKITYS